MTPNPRLQFEPTKRFTSRADNYVKYRPSYPVAMIHYLEQQYNLTPTSTIADVGSGTGLLTKLFLDNGNPVYGIEPNEAMRTAAEQFLADYPLFTSLAATAESTTLPDEAIDFVTAGQAFHWFDPAPTQQEFRRILRPQGHIILVWNTRHPDSPFMEAYDELMERWSPRYREVRQGNDKDGDIGRFLSQQMEKVTFDNPTWLDLEGLRGRALSSSYAPLPDHPNHAPLMAGLDDLFARHQENGQVQFLYQTEVFIGR